MTAPGSPAGIQACLTRTTPSAGGNHHQEEEHMLQSTGKKTGTLVLGGVMACLMTIWGVSTVNAQTVGEITRGGTLNAAQAAKWSSLDPTLSSGRTNDKFIINQIYETLIELDAEGAYVPGLADSWEVLDDKTLIFKLKKGVQFHDGNEFNAESVKFLLERGMNPETKATYRSEVSDIASIEVMDTHTVKIEMKTPSSAILGVFANYAGYMVSPAAVQKYGKDIVRNPIGTGPFKMKEAVEGDHINLVRNEAYHRMGADGKALPYLDGVNVKIIPDDSVKLVNLKSGGLDLIDSVQTMNIPSLERSKDIQIVPTAATRVFKLIINVNKGPTAKKEVRQAIAHALKRDEFVKVVCSGYCAIAPFIVQKSQWFYSPDNGYEYNPAKAKELLAKAGYPNGFKAKLSFTSREPDKTIIQLVQIQLKELGIDASIETYDRLAFNSTWVKGDGEIGLNFAPIPKPDPYIQFQIFFATKANNNFTGYSNPTFDDLLEKSKQTYDLGARKVAYGELQKILLEDSPEVVLFQLPLYQAHHKKLQGFQVEPEGSWVLREAWIKK
jgi:peptide/nickel transport system substrate-binding protein